MKRRTYMAAVAGTSIGGLSGCLGSFGLGEEPTEIRIIASDHSHELYPDIDGIDIDLRTSSSSVIGSNWARDGNPLYEEYDIAIVRNTNLLEIIDSGHVTPVVADSLTYDDDIYDAVARAQEGEPFARNGDRHALLTRFDWIGYCYDIREITDPGSSWNVLFQDELDGNDLEGRVRMPSNPVYLVTTAAFHLGYEDGFEGETFGFSAEELDSIEETLREQQPLVNNYGGLTDRYRTGGPLVGVTNQDNVNRHKLNHGGNLELVIPDEGALMTYAGGVVSSDSEHPEEAWQVIDAMRSPENGVYAPLRTGSHSPNPGFVDHLPESYADIIVPVPEDDFDRLIPLKTVDDRESWEAIGNELT